MTWSAPDLLQPLRRLSEVRYVPTPPLDRTRCPEPALIPVLDLANDPVVDDVSASRVLSRACDGLLEKGVVLLKNVFERPLVERVHDEFMRDYDDYIEDRDYRSKATFALLTLLFSLQSGDRTAATPAVTIPLN